MKRGLLQMACLLFGWALVQSPMRGAAQGLQEEATPYSAWLDLQRLSAKSNGSGGSRAGLPAWLESVGRQASAVDGQAATTTFRLRLLELRNLEKEMQLRLFFDDREELAPRISGWSETGTLRFESRPLGSGLGLPTSETVTFATGGLDFVEITVPGDGSNIRGAFLALMKTEEAKRALDFQTPKTPADAFGNLPPLAPKDEDLTLYGRVSASIDRKTVKLTPPAAPAVWQFALESPPLLALVTFEVLGVDGLALPELSVNRRPLGSIAPHWPDLADPGYRGMARPLDADLRFRYAGWLRCQKIIPGSALKAGDNDFAIQLHAESGPVAVRSVALQLKYNWKNLDYTLAPATP